MTSLNPTAEFASQLRATTGQIPITEFAPEDLFIVAYPKSGNTWFQNLASGVIFGVDPRYAPDSLIQELVPDVHYKHYYKRLSTPMPFKSHDRARVDYRRVVYLLRDGRDVMVSHLHHLAAVLGRELSAEDEMNFVQEDAANWQRHVAEWLANPFGAAMLTIRYEELLQDAPGVLRRFCDFAGFDRDDSFLEQVAGGATFETMRQKELRWGWNNPAWPREKAFIRRGIAGSHRDELRPELMEAFMERGGETLRKCGYLG